MEKICVIGGSGFIGSVLCRMLLEDGGISVGIVDKVISNKFPSITKIHDIKNPIDVDIMSSCSVIVNLAAEHRDDITPKSLFEETNVVGARNICEIATVAGINKIIFTSSVAIYGFALPGTGEDGLSAPFNDYGITKLRAESVYKAWQSEDPLNRSLVIIRPTVVFGKGNRGNVFNLLKQISDKRFLMIGNGLNKKSMCYVENVAQFIKHTLNLNAGVHVYNYVDKPDFTMNELIIGVKHCLGHKGGIGFRVPYLVGIGIGYCFDLLARITRKKFPISFIRVKKFCTDSVYSSKASETGFIPEFEINAALKETIHYEFLDSFNGKNSSRGENSTSENG
jgi:nucleoside-diphosphate-sugar epimerase